MLYINGRTNNGNYLDALVINNVNNNSIDRYVCCARGTMAEWASIQIITFNNNFSQFDVLEKNGLRRYTFNSCTINNSNFYEATVIIIVWNRFEWKICIERNEFIIFSFVFFHFFDTH